MTGDDLPSRDRIKKMIEKLQGSQSDVPDLPDDKVRLIWKDHTTMVPVPDSAGNEYYLDVEEGRLYRFNLANAWATNLQNEDSEGLMETADEDE